MSATTLAVTDNPDAGIPAAPVEDSPAARAAAYAKTRRDDARRAGQPVPRTAFPGFVTLPAFELNIATVTKGVISLRRFDVTAGTSSAPVVVPAARLGDILETGQILVEDRTALHALRAAITAEARRPGADRSVWRTLDQFAVAESLKQSAHVIVLTDALARKFYAPTGVNTSKMAGWLTAFKIPASSGRRVGLLVQYAALNHGSGIYDRPARHAFDGERRAIEQAKFGNGMKALKLKFASVQTAEDNMAALTVMDEIARERLAITGDVCKLRLLNVTKWSFTATVSQPFKLSEGKEVLLLSASGSGQAHSVFSRLEISPDGDSLIGTFKSPVRTETWFLDETKRKFGGLLFAVAAPRTGNFNRNAPNSRWVVDRPGGGVDWEPGVRSVPPDIVFAGAPTLDQ